MIRSFRASAIILCLVICWSVSTSVGQTRPSGSGSDFKVKYKVTFNSGGQTNSSESVTMIKGARERSESSMGFGYDTVNITQCDLKRTIQISDRVQKYLITPIEVGDSATTTQAPATPPAPAAPANTTRRGGTVTYVTTTVDTGERREMFGFTARHVKSSTAIQSSPDACSPVNQRTEVDGWYIDLSVSFNCNVSGAAATAPRSPAAVGCRDQVKFRREGSGRLGYPLIETMKMYDASGQVTFSTTKEVLELSRESLDSALFDIPAGYTAATNQQELYGAQSVAQIMSNTAATAGDVSTARVPSPATTDTKQPGAIRVGVVQLNNKSGKPVSAEPLRQRLIRNIQSAGIDAIALNGTSPVELEAEAQAKHCDYILYSDIPTLKMSKLGGLFGSVTGTSGLGKTEAKIEFRLFALGETKPALQSSSTAKEEGDENSAGVAVDTEARTVVAEVRKRKR